MLQLLRSFHYTVTSSLGLNHMDGVLGLMHHDRTKYTEGCRGCQPGALLDTLSPGPSPSLQEPNVEDVSVQFVHLADLFACFCHTPSCRGSEGGTCSSKIQPRNRGWQWQPATVNHIQPSLL